MPSTGAVVRENFNTFMVKYAVKKKVISLVLYFLCVYLDGLLCKLQVARIGCRIGNLFTGVLANRPCLRYIIKLCGGYINAFSIVNNATK